MSNVVKLYPNNAADNPDNVLEQAVGVYQDVLILGYAKSGELDVRSSSSLTAAQALYLVDKFKHKLLAGDYEVEE